MFGMLNAHILCPYKTNPKPAFQREHVGIFLMKVPRNSQILKRGSSKIFSKAR